MAQAIDSNFPGLKRTLDTLKKDVLELKNKGTNNPFDPRNPFSTSTSAVPPDGPLSPPLEGSPSFFSANSGLYVLQ